MHGSLKNKSLGYLDRIKKASICIDDLIDDQLDLSRVACSEIRLDPSG